MLKDWRKTASGSALQIAVSSGQDQRACAELDLTRRAAVQNKLANICETMCKEVGAYPKCTQCPDFVEPDSTPGVMTWPELLEHMDNLSEWGHGMLSGGPEAPCCGAEQACEHLRDYVQRGRSLPQVHAVPRLRGARLYARCHDLARAAGAHGQS